MSGPLAEVEAQTAFVGLLTRPLVTGVSDPTLHRLVRRHHRTLAGWAAKCGYRVVAVGDATRLHRLPLAGVVAHPTPFPAPSRRMLVLALAAAAACEDGETTTTVQMVSDRVRDITGLADSPVSAYQPDRRAERVLLVRALELLERFGALRRRTHDEQLVRTWEDHREGVGRGYEVDRAALLQLVDPSVVAAAFSHNDGIGSAATSQRVLRRILETQAVLYVDLDELDAEWLRSRRARVAEDVTRMTGGIVEMRLEGLLLVLPSERNCEATVDWPRPTTDSWVALLLADAAMAGARADVDDHGCLRVPSFRVDELVAALHETRGPQLTRELREDPERLRSRAEQRLLDAGVLVIDGEGAWTLLPTAARYRDPEILMSGVATLGDDE